MIAVLGAGDSPARAQGRDVLIGTSIRREPHLTASDLGLRSAAPQFDREREASRLLQYARDDLAAGNLGVARLELANLVRRYGGTLAAEEAQRILARMQGALGESRVAPTSEREAPGNRRSGHWTAEGAGGGSDANSPQHAPEVQRRALERSFRQASGDRVFFANGNAELGARERDALAAQARWLARNPRATVTLEAHADDGGTAANNTALARQRAEAVRQQLIGAGIAAERIRMLVHGRDRPVAPCPREDCAMQNRRVVTTITTASRDVPRQLRTGTANLQRD